MRNRLPRRGRWPRAAETGGALWLQVAAVVAVVVAAAEAGTVARLGGGCGCLRRRGGGRGGGQRPRLLVTSRQKPGGPAVNSQSTSTTMAITPPLRRPELYPSNLDMPAGCSAPRSRVHQSLSVAGTPHRGCNDTRSIMLGFALAGEVARVAFGAQGERERKQGCRPRAAITGRLCGVKQAAGSGGRDLRRERGTGRRG